MYLRLQYKYFYWIREKKMARIMRGIFVLRDDRRRLMTRLFRASPQSV
jgi:hypothetical protein